MQTTQGRRLPGRQVPGPRGSAHGEITGQACGREVTVGGAAGMELSEVRQEIRHRIGGAALNIPEACDELVDTALRWWPERRMADYAREPSTSGPATLDAISVISAKVREDVEARWGMEANVCNALDLLCMAVVVEVANIWFSSVENRIELRRILFEVRHRHR
jgi:hypothetical protein